MRRLNRSSQVLRTFVNWFSARAWSRAGAVARELAVAPRRRAATAARGVAIHLVGSLVLALGVAMLLWNDFGPGPLDVFIVAVRDHTGLPLAVALWLTVGSFLMIAWVLGRRPGIGSLATPIVIGPAIQAILSMLSHYESPSSLGFKVTVQLVAIAVVGLGAGAIIASGLGAGMGELLASAASDKSGQPEPLVRVGFELTLMALGVLLGGPFGLGTVIVAIAIGPAVSHGYRVVNGALSNFASVIRRSTVAPA